jgi:hypothetical protein
LWQFIQTALAEKSSHASHSWVTHQLADLSILGLQRSHAFTVITDEGPSESTMEMRIGILDHRAEFVTGEQSLSPIGVTLTGPSSCANSLLGKDRWPWRVYNDQHGNQEHHRQQYHQSQCGHGNIQDAPEEIVVGPVIDQGAKSERVKLLHQVKINLLIRNLVVHWFFLLRSSLLFEA